MSRTRQIGCHVTLAVLSLSATAAGTRADELWSGNGHYYRVVHVSQNPNSWIHWAAAWAAAEAAGGYLATCTSAEENAFVFSLLSDPLAWSVIDSTHVGPWLGGVQPNDAPTPSSGWAWVTGEPWSFTAWAPGQPDDAGSKAKKVLHYLYGDTEGAAATWNALPARVDPNRATYLPSFVVEFDSQPEIPPWTKSTFQTGPEGWATCGDATVLAWQEPTASARGCVLLSDLKEGLTGSFLAPAQFLGNKAGAYGGAFSFALKTTEGVDLHPSWDVRLVGADRSLSFDLPDPAVNRWTPRLARLTEDAGWRVGAPNGPPATREDLLSVLGDLKAILINGEFHYGSDTTMIDDVVLSIRPDLDRDGDVDSDDANTWVACATGPAIPAETEACRDADMDHDADVDQDDFGVLQRCYRGENMPSDMGCNR